MEESATSGQSDGAATGVARVEAGTPFSIRVIGPIESASSELAPVERPDTAAAPDEVQPVRTSPFCTRH
jgi:hypothetical protein